MDYFIEYQIAQDRVRFLEEEVKLLNDLVEKYQEHLLAALEYLDHGVPSSCGGCGGPAGNCDMDCVNAHYYAVWRAEMAKIMPNNEKTK